MILFRRALDPRVARLAPRLTARFSMNST